MMMSEVHASALAPCTQKSAQSIAVIVPRNKIMVRLEDDTEVFLSEVEST